MFRENLLVIVISTEIQNPKSESRIKGILGNSISTPSLRIFNCNDSLLPKHVRKLIPSFAFLHKTIGKTKALEKIIVKNSPFTKIIHIPDDEYWPEALKAFKTLAAIP